MATLDVDLFAIDGFIAYNTFPFFALHFGFQRFQHVRFEIESWVQSLDKFVESCVGVFFFRFEPTFNWNEVVMFIQMASPDVMSNHVAESARHL
jgi:hypothetical protein